MKYLILSSPRTGSTMLAAALNATGNAGRVKEYFHLRTLAERGDPELAKQSMLAYYADVVSANTSGNGVFGMKLHFNQFHHVFGGKRIGMGSGVSFLKSFDRHVLVYRRDKVLQAVSELIATKTDLWNTSDRKAAGRASVEFSDTDLPLLAQIMSRQMSEEYAWRSLLQDCAITAHEIAYEDLTAAPDAELSKLAVYLDIGDLGPLKASQDTVKLTDTTATAAIKQRFLAALGAG
ncbi:MAG: Stf0 family sulfotransferase [Aestuariivirga sp.]|jgi:trehalose 2-sulfotransferase|uniref:Stf0 family sulfotransferase n=1 Tax=Aestuariivirga sp. TaxID=2650926 RepID=UPI00301A527F